ncbi:uncharacterized protein isoform X2 [Choristoneura fumiferana]
MAHYLSTEHPAVTYVNAKYLANVSFTAIRYGRRDPIYYLNLYGTTLIDLDNNITVNLYAYQIPKHGPTLMELHKKWCDLVYKDELIGPILRSHVPESCPTPKGDYRLANMTTANIAIPFIESLPFTKARLFLYSTIRSERLAEGYIDVEVKLQRAKG